MPFNGPNLEQKLGQVGQSVSHLQSWLTALKGGLGRSRGDNSKAIWDARRAAYALLEVAADLEEDLLQLPPP